MYAPALVHMFMVSFEKNVAKNAGISLMPACDCDHAGPSAAQMVEQARAAVKAREAISARQNRQDRAQSISPSQRLRTIDEICGQPAAIVLGGRSEGVDVHGSIR